MMHTPSRRSLLLAQGEAMNELRDELRQMCPFNESPRLLDAIIEKVERALAAERAAMKCGHPHACLKTRPFVPSNYPYEPPLSRTEEFCTACERLAAERAATIEQCARVADADARQSRALAEDRYGSPVGDFDEDHFLHEASTADEVARNIRKLPRDRSALDDALAQARRKQREKDAATLEALMPSGGNEAQAMMALAMHRGAIAIRAQED